MRGNAFGRSSLLTLLDDIATLLDDISVMGKLAAKKTAGVLGMTYRSMRNKFQACGPTGNFPWSGAWRKDR
ncbi:putative methyl-independent mismatch repair protein [Escherichia coli]|uniref:Putative methyl-independent mismatch repair protein n=1 Tax=Escherichia coli TaxID=562 RepID=A0A376WWT6_ECOLX|nr:putative methyl-independent mismatch repair protein [Escherichia coli]